MSGSQIMGCSVNRQGRQGIRGAAAVEFALVFIPFFVIFYALASYALVFTLTQAMTQAAEEGARAAVAALGPEDFPSQEAYLSNVRGQVRATVADTLSWLPAATRELVVGAEGANVAVEPVDVNGALGIEVEITYPDYSANPLVPLLTFPVFGAVPRVPENLVARAVVTL